MATQIAQITFDCDNPLEVGRFWSAALDRPTREGANEFFVAIDGGGSMPNMFFIKVPEAKEAKNRVHLDLGADDPEAEIERLVGLGATRVAEKDEWDHRWTVMTDVEGNEFCISAHH